MSPLRATTTRPFRDWSRRASGVALIPRLALARVHPGIVVRALSPRSLMRHVVVATATDPTLAPAARAMLQILLDNAPLFRSGPDP